MKSTKSKKACSSKQSSKFLEKNTGSLQFNTLAMSLTDFASKTIDDEMTSEIDEDLSRNLRRLEKKDHITKQKSLNELIDILKTKDLAAVLASLKYWSKMYGKLYLHDDKKVRELTQKLMYEYSRICGRDLAPFIKLILPFWIVSQSDMHTPAAQIAKLSFNETFPTDTKRQKAYFLCWSNIFSNINGTFNKAAMKIENVNFTKPEESYIEQLCVSMRTLLVVLPFLKGNEESMNDVLALLNSKQFWSHFKNNAPIVQNIYLQFFTDFLQNYPNYVLESSFIASNFCECLRMINNYHSFTISRLWVAVETCCRVLQQQTWKYVSFKSVFLPKLLRLLEVGAEGQLSEIFPHLIATFKHLPIEFDSIESVSVVEHIFDALTKAYSYNRNKNSQKELNTLTNIYYIVAIYYIVESHKTNNETIFENVFKFVFDLTEKYLTNSDLLKITDFISCLCNYIIKPTLNKGLVKNEVFIKPLVTWLKKHNESELFCEHLTRLFVEIHKIAVKDERVRSLEVEIYNEIRDLLSQYVLQENKDQCLIPLFFISSDNVFSNDKSVLAKCGDIIKIYKNEMTYIIICNGMANIYNNSADTSALHHMFLSTLTEVNKYLFYEMYYPKMIPVLNVGIRDTIAAETIDIWINDLKLGLIEIIDSETDSFVDKYKIILDHLANLPVHKEDIKAVVHLINSELSCRLNNQISQWTNQQLISIIHMCIDHMHRKQQMGVLPFSIIAILVKLTLCSNESIDLRCIEEFYRFVSESGDVHQSTMEIVNELFSLTDCYRFDELSNILSTVLGQLNLDSQLSATLQHISKIFIEATCSLEEQVRQQFTYKTSLTQLILLSMEILMHKLCLVLPIVEQSTSHNYDELRETLNTVCVLLYGLVEQNFYSCRQNNSVLDMCERLHPSTQALVQSSEFMDQLVMRFAGVENAGLVGRCASLFMSCLQHWIPVDYTTWSPTLCKTINDFLGGWSQLPEPQFSLGLCVFIGASAKARYLVQETIIAELSVFLSSSNDLHSVSRSVSLMSSLIQADPDYFTVCYPLLIQLKPQFDCYIDQLYPAGSEFDLTALLQLLTAAVDSGKLEETAQWEFVLCLTAALSRSVQFSPCIEMRDHHDTNADPLVNGYWLLRLICAITVAMETVNHDTIVDEWENFFSESLFVCLLDQFSHVAGDHTQGQIVCSDIFQLYLEALCEAVSLCPVSVLLSHTFIGEVHPYDPIELPPNLIRVLNFFLDSLSNLSLSVQMAAYNALLNLLGQLRDHLNNELNKKDVDDCIESFTLSLPQKFVIYLDVSDDLLQLDFTSSSHHSLITRTVLIWNLCLQLITLSAPKLRAEIAAYLSSSPQNRFDNFLQFAYSFMPKTPIINKFHYKFLSRKIAAVSLIAKEPSILNRCSDARSDFLLYHLTCHTFARCVQTLPTLTRVWWQALDNKSQAAVQQYVKQFITPELCRREFELLKLSYRQKSDDENKFSVEAIPMLGEVTVRYEVAEDQTIEMLVQLPSNYPLGQVTVRFKKENVLKDNRWRSWVIQVTATIQNQNGSIMDGVSLLQRHLDGYFSGLDECMICYALLHQTKYTLPGMRCRQCRKKFHKDCMFKWFQSTPNPTCPNCRNLFFDGSYKRGVGVPNIDQFDPNM